MKDQDRLPARIALPVDLRAFEESFREFQEVANEVRDLAVAAGKGILGHGQIEQHLCRRIFDVARGMLQNTFDQLSREEEKRGDVLGPDGTVLRYPRERQRRLETVFGEVFVNRLGYRDRGTMSVFPLDDKLNLPPTRYSHGLQMLAAELVGQESYDSAISHISRLTGGSFPKRQMEEMARDFSLDFDSYYTARSIALAPYQEPSKDLLIVSVDGKGIVMRLEDLREETRRRAEGSDHKLQKRLSRGEKRNRKRMATAAVVYDVARHHRSAEDIILANHRSKDAPKPTQKRVWASVKKEPAEVLDDVFEEVKGRDPQGQRTLVILVDGQEEQLRQVTAALKRHKRKAIIIQDIYHVSEYLWQACWCFHTEGDSAAQVWVDERLMEILRGKASHVAAGMTRSATLRGLSESEREPVDRCARYLCKNSERLDYAKALKIGAPIGTGAVEGACRHLIRSRMECSGARWSLEGAEAVLRLRALWKSGDWDSYCEYHWLQEHHRNYPECSNESVEAA